MFPVVRKNKILPFPYLALNGLLKRAAHHCGFDMVLSHAFKRAALTNAFLANEKELVKVSPRVLKDIGDHSKTYHERYVRLGVDYIADLMVEIKKAFLSDFRDGLPTQDREDLDASFNLINVRQHAYAIQNFLEVCGFGLESV